MLNNSDLLSIENRGNNTLLSHGDVFKRVKLHVSNRWTSRKECKGTCI